MLHPIRFYQLVMVTLCLFGFSSTKLIEEDSSGSKLIFSHVIFRHGDRNIHKTYPNDPYKDELHWPGGIGQLTKKGKQQEYKLGQFLKRRYNKLIGDKYSPDKVYVRSTDYDRTIMSALVNLAGLYPPTGDDIWNEDISNWQPIPVHTIPLIADYVLYGPKNCSKYDAVFQEYIKNSPEVQKLQTKYQQLLKFWSKMCGSDIKTIGDASLLYNTLYIENLHNKSLAAWAQKAIEPNGIMEYMAKFYFQMGSATPQLARLRTGFLIKEMLERFTQKINATLSPDRSLWLYSSHDLMISNMLNTLGLFKLHLPNYASSLHFELYKTEKNENYFQFFYRNAEEEHLLPMNIPKCGEKCSLDQFYAAYSEIIPGDRDTECSLP